MKFINPLKILFNEFADDVIERNAEQLFHDSIMRPIPNHEKIIGEGPHFPPDFRPEEPKPQYSGLVTHPDHWQHLMQQ